jgi:hypothetical protein
VISDLSRTRLQGCLHEPFLGKYFASRKTLLWW